MKTRWNGGVDDLRSAASPTALLALSHRIPNCALNCCNHAKISFQIGWSKEHDKARCKKTKLEKLLSRTRNRCFWLEKLFLWVGRDMNYVCYRHPHSVAAWFLLKYNSSSTPTPNGVEKIVIFFYFMKKERKQTLNSSFAFTFVQILNCVLYFLSKPCFFFTSAASSYNFIPLLSYTERTINNT